MRGPLAAMARNGVFANLLAVSLLVAGINAATSLPRETFPETAVDHVLVTVPYPGASPGDIEPSVCVKVEQAIQGIPGIWEVSSYSEENQGLIVAAVDPRILPTAEVLRQIQDRVRAITTLPPQTEQPSTTEVVVRSAVISVGVHGDAPYRAVQRVAEQIRDDLLAIPEISQVGVSGARLYEIAIQLSEEALNRYGLTLQGLMETIAQGSLDVPAGVIRTQREEISVRTIGQRFTAHDYQDLVVLAQPDGTSVRLGQIAEVRDTVEETPVFGRVNGQPGMMVHVAKTSTEDTIQIARRVREYVSTSTPGLPEGIRLSVWGDAARDIDARLKMLLSNAISGMVLVVVCLLVFLDLRSSISVTLGIPVAFAGAFMAMQALGITLNMISLMGLLMATGMIVDDAIVIAESVRERVRGGLEPLLAAVEGTRRVWVPVVMSSVTTIVAFTPLMYVEGVMGKLIFALPVVVSMSLVASAVEAFMILPAHLNEWSGPVKSDAPLGRRARVRRFLDARIDGFIERKYGPVLRAACRGRAVVASACAVAVLVCVGLIVGGHTPFVLFPKIDGNTLRARVRFPEGTPIEACEQTVARIEQAAFALNDDEELLPATPGKLVEQVYAVAGEWADFIPLRDSSLCEVSVELMPAEFRQLDCAKIIEHWRRGIGEVPDALLVAITRQELGPTEKPIEIRLLGEDLDTLRSAADELSAKLDTFAGVFDIEDDLLPGKRELQVTLKPAASNLGLSVAWVASQIRQGLYGGEAVRLQRGRDEVKVMVSLASEDRRSISALENLRIRTPQGREVPFAEVADLRSVRGFSRISRQDGLRRARVYADVDERYANAEQIVQNLQAGFLPELDRRFPGVTYLLDGQRKRIEESMSSLLRGFAVAMVAMFALIGTVLRSYAQPIIIMTAIPLGFVGAIFGHAVMGRDLTLMSVFGAVGLAGVVVNDSLVLIDRINENVRQGKSVFEAVVDGGLSRFRAVILTTVTTVAGLFPLLLERSSQAQSLIPMAISLVFGLSLATVLTLLIVPVLFLLVNDGKRFVRWLVLGGVYPRPEQVERDAPAVARAPAG